MPTADGEAAIRATLNSGEFLGALRRMSGALQQTSDTGKRNFKALGAGIDAAKGKMRELAGSAGTALKGIAALGGGLSFAGGIKGAVELDAKMRALAYRVEVATQAGVDHMDLQRELERQAALTSRTTGEMATAFDTVFSATKDLEFTKGVLQAIGDTATATHSEIGTVATIAQQMSRKFKLSSSEVQQAMAQIFEGAQQGGPSFQQFSETIDLVGAALIDAGFEGKRAMNFLIGALNETDAEFGSLRKQVAGLQGVLISATDPNRLRKMAKELNIPAKQLLDEKDFAGVLRRILSKGQKGLDTLRATFVGPEERKALRVIFTQPFEDALNRAKASGLKGKDAIDQALGVLDSRIGQFGQGALTAAKLQEHAAKEREAPEAQMRTALETLTKSFAQPELINSINDLAKILPQVAKAAGAFLSFVAKHPLLSAGGFVGAQVGGSFLGGMLREAGAGVAAKIAAAHVVGATTTSEKIVAAHLAGSAKLQSALIGGGAIAAAALAAALIKADAEKDAATTGKLSVARARASGVGGSLESQKQNADALARAIKEREAAQNQFSTVLFKGLAGSISGEDLFAKEAKELAEAKMELQVKRASIARQQEDQQAVAQAVAQAGATPAQMPSGTPGASKVSLDSMAPRLIATATAEAMGARVLQVQIVNGPPGSIGATARSFGSRGPMSIPSPASGGGF